MKGSLSPDVFAARRERLFDLLDGIPAVLTAPPEVRRNADTHYRYRPDSSFRYFTGFTEPNAVMVFTSDRQFRMFVRPRDAEREVWDGERFGPEGVVTHFNADQAHTIDQLEEELKPLLAKTERLAFAPDTRSPLSRRIHALIEDLAMHGRDDKGPTSLLRPRTFIEAIRTIKDEHDLGLHRRAAAITAGAHAAALGACKPGMYEYELEALLQYEFLRNGADWAYPPIVAGGANACVLHYRDNDAVLKDGSLVLIDAGAEFEGCAADVTRTFPVSGRFEGAAKEVYEVVLEVQKTCLKAAVPGCTIAELQELAVADLTLGMKDLGLLSGDVQALIEDKSYKRYYPHGLGHFLGMDVHDLGKRVEGGEPRPLPVGTMITVEPGLYIPRHDEDAPAAFRGIGVRGR